MSQAPFLGVYALKYSYPRSHDRAAPVVNEVSFELERGEILSLFGPNGSGKSTLLKLLAGILPLAQKSGDSGQVRLAGEDFFSRGAAYRARQITYLGPELRAEFPITAHEAVMMGRACYQRGLFRHVSEDDRAAVTQAMHDCLCWELRDRDLLTLSGGEKQLVGLARAIAQGARILLLDEALSRMDLNHQALMGNLLRRLAGEGKSIILVSHDFNLGSEWADTALLLKGGSKVASGRAREVLSEANLRALYPGAGLFVGANPQTGAPKVFFAPAQK